jgi:hypothetical protein
MSSESEMFYDLISSSQEESLPGSSQCHSRCQIEGPNYCCIGHPNDFPLWIILHIIIRLSADTLRTEYSFIRKVVIISNTPLLHYEQLNLIKRTGK